MCYCEDHWEENSGQEKNRWICRRVNVLILEFTLGHMLMKTKNKILKISILKNQNPKQFWEDHWEENPGEV